MPTAARCPGFRACGAARAGRAPSASPRPWGLGMNASESASDLPRLRVLTSAAFSRFSVTRLTRSCAETSRRSSAGRRREGGRCDHWRPQVPPDHTLDPARRSHLVGAGGWGRWIGHDGDCWRGSVRAAQSNLTSVCRARCFSVGDPCGRHPTPWRPLRAMREAFPSGRSRRICTWSRTATSPSPHLGRIAWRCGCWPATTARRGGVTGAGREYVPGRHSRASSHFKRRRRASTNTPPALVTIYAVEMATPPRRAVPAGPGRV